MSVNIKKLVEELRQGNSHYHGFVFNEVYLFLNELQSDPDQAPKNTEQEEYFLFSAGQGFITGYGAALDGNYDEDAVCNYDSPEFSLAINAVGDFSEWQKARIAKYDKTIVSMMGEGPLSYYSCYGFASGFAKGFEDIESGDIESPGQSLSIEEIKEICQEALDEILNEVSPQISWLAGEKTTKKSGKIAKMRRTIENAIFEATVKYVLSISGGHSGYNDADPQIAYNRACTYAAAFSNGLFDGCIGELPKAGDYDLEMFPSEFKSPLGALVAIDSHYGENVDVAMLAKSELAEFLETFEDEELDDPDYADEDEDIPSFEDAFWQIHAIGYADGAVYASRKPNLHAKMDAAGQKRLDRIYEEQIEILEREYAVLNSFFGEDGELSDEYAQHLDEVCKDHVEERDGKKVLVVNEDFYRQLGLP